MRRNTDLCTLKFVSKKNNFFESINLFLKELIAANLNCDLYS